MVLMCPHLTQSLFFICKVNIEHLYSLLFICTSRRFIMRWGAGMSWQLFTHILNILLSVLQEYYTDFPLFIWIFPSLNMQLKYALKTLMFLWLDVFNGLLLNGVMHFASTVGWCLAASETVERAFVDINELFSITKHALRHDEKSAERRSKRKKTSRDKGSNMHTYKIPHAQWKPVSLKSSLRFSHERNLVKPLE